MDLHVYSVTKNYNINNNIIKALDKVSFSINKNKFVAILGESKSGKTTLLNLLGGLDRVTSGDIIVNGKNITKFSENELTNYRRENIAFIFKENNLISNLTVFENIDVSSVLSKNALDINNLLKILGLEKKSNLFPKQITEEEIKLVSIAKGICKNSNMLIFDEIIDTLNNKNRKMVLELLSKISSISNKIIVISTTKANNTLFADKVIHLENGKIVSKGGEKYV